MIDRRLWVPNRRQAVCGVATLALAAGRAGAQGAPLFIVKQGLQLPECALHDTARDLYVVSNINGPPLAKEARDYRHSKSASSRIRDDRLFRQPCKQ